MIHDIARNLERVRARLPQRGVTLVAVSKFHPAEAVMEAYARGQRVFGESRAQELAAKAEALPDDIEWHFIGHLQTNKVRPVVRYASMIQSVDSPRLLQAIDTEALKQNKTVKVLMQLHVAREETKFGFTPDELKQWFVDRNFETLKATHICGVMGMASNTDDITRIEADFHLIADTFRLIGETIAPDLRGFDTISMGMSHDLESALLCGSTMVRIGTDIFGSR